MTTRRNPCNNIKNEPVKVFGGFPTPNSSISSAGTFTPKTEEDSGVSFSDTIEGNFNTFRSHDGLRREFDDEGYATQVYQEQERKIRSTAPSFRTSRQPSPHHEIMDLTVMEPQTPGASLQVVGKKVNLLVNAIDKLRQLGLKEIDTELPELVLVGDQSAGKSSLMGAIAEINLPKDDGMCTRCPSNIKTSPATTWSCTVSLQEYFFYSKDARRMSTKAQPFPPWKEKPGGLDITHFTTIHDKAELENVLRWAQIALLNPTQDSKSYVPGTGAVAQKGLNKNDKHEADFSPNLVAIEISGPGLPALSFYDLPGIFVSAANKAEDYLVPVFEKLATKYIMHPNALVICAMTMAIDPGLSRTSALIKELKAEKRSVGVLTMPDRLQSGSTHTDFDKILRGQTYTLPQGYFVTKQPGQDFKLRHGADHHAQAREEEKAFFGSDSRWTDEWNEFLPRCGTTAIQTYLSQEFAKQIAKSMPSINAKIKEQTEAVDKALLALPALPAYNVQHVVRGRLQRFSNGVQRLLEGGPSSNGFLSTWSQLSIDFRDAIQTMRPMFSYFHPSDMELPEVPEVIDIDDDSDLDLPPTTHRNAHGKRPAGEGFATPHGGPRQKNMDGSGVFSRDPATLRPIQQPNFVAKQEGSRAGSSAPVRPPRPQQMKPPPRKTVFDPHLDMGKNFMTIAEVRTIIAKHKRPGLPDHVDDAARGDICMSSVNSWSYPLETLADHTFKMLRSAVLDMLNHCLGDYKQTELFRASERHIIKFLDMHAVAQREKLMGFYALENYKLFTINNLAFEKYKTEELKTLQDARRKRRVTCYVKKQAQLARKGHSETSRLNAEKAVTDVQLGSDPFENEIQLAAYVRGYYKTAGLRFADNICQNIQGNLFRNVHADILGLLEGSLNLNEGDGEKTCHDLMIEDKGEAKQRLDLQDKKAKWTSAAESLTDLVRKFAIEDATESDHEQSEDDTISVDGPNNNSIGYTSPGGRPPTPPAYAPDEGI